MATFEANAMVNTYVQSQAIAAQQAQINVTAESCVAPTKVVVDAAAYTTADANKEARCMSDLIDPAVY